MYNWFKSYGNVKKGLAKERICKSVLNRECMLIMMRLPCLPFTIAFTWKVSHGLGATNYGDSLIISINSQEQSYLQWSALQLSAVVFKGCIFLQLSWQFHIFLTVCSCLDNLQFSWQSAVVLTGLNCLNSLYLQAWQSTNVWIDHFVCHICPCF